MNLKVCGPKCSLCCTLLSVWAIVQLGIMGILFWVKSPAFIEDLNIPDEAKHPHDLTPEQGAFKYLEAMNTSFEVIAKNCGIAAGLYAVTLIFSGWQMWLNKRN